MATQEKLVKSLETLQQILNSNLSFEPTRKKEKISLCTFITETLSNPSIRVAPSFGNLLSWSVQVFLQVCGDSESDVCLVGDECLNRLIRATIDGHASKIQIELHKKIKENSDAKSLRAALWRFAELAHFIRPNKGKPYVANFLPVLCKVIERQEELIHETLGNSMPKIMTSLGNFMTDADVKTLLKGFLNNIQSTSPVLRRTAANCILPICLHCKNSNYFFIFTFNTLINALLPIEESHTSALIIGAMGCLKQVIPHLNSPKYDSELKGSFGVTKESSEVTVAVEKYIQVYELCLYYLTNSDHNVINASLETLNIFLQYCPPDCKDILLSPDGISKSFLLFDANSRLKFKSPSSLSVTTTTLSGDDLLHSESDLLDSVRPDIEKWIDDSKLSVININYVDGSSQLPAKNSTIDHTDYDIASFDGGSECAVSLAETESSDFVKPDYIAANTDRLVLSEKSSEKSCSFQDTKSIDTYYALQDVYIGSFNDKDVPLLYCIRLLSKSFLLAGKMGSLIPDKNMRVSVKSLTLTCLSTIARLYPEGFFQSLDKNEDGGTEKQYISDVLLYSDHSDPQLRGSVRSFVASFIETVIVNSGNDYKEWILKHSLSTEGNVFDIKNLIKVLVKGLEDESSTCVRQTVTGLEGVLQKLLQSHDNQHALPLLHALPFVINNPYWLVKVKLLKVLSDLCYTTIYYITGNSHFQNKILYSVLFEMLKDDDPRVRKTCSKAIVKIIPYLYFPQDNYNVDDAVYKAKQFRKEQVSEMPHDENDISPIKKRFISELVFPFNKINEEISEEVCQSLSRVVMGLKEIMLISKSKYFIYGCIETLRRLSISYPPTIYSTSWGCFESFSLDRDKPLSGSIHGFDLYNICVTLLTSSSLTYDISCHINLLDFAGNIFAGN
ncbi:huntingtin-like [Agrilus planipennis]|uniref:Huntingtin-like n=1 Tax=Agrilus planipennis TaxID=224129 RepID=A0A7F5REV8_AGRPL|nr:huntingtin-like [Agrilus planipennis]